MSVKDDLGIESQLPPHEWAVSETLVRAIGSTYLNRGFTEDMTRNLRVLSENIVTHLGYSLAERKSLLNEIDLKKQLVVQFIEYATKNGVK